MKKTLSSAMVLGLAAILSAAPQTGTPQTGQPAHTGAKQTGGKHKHKKPHGDHNGQNTHKTTPQHTTVKPGN